MLTQKLTLVPHSPLNSGSASYSIDESTGKGDASEDIFAGIAFFTKELKDDGTFQIDPKMLLSASIVLGMKVVQGSFDLEVTSVVPGKSAVVAVTVNVPDEATGSGSVVLNLTGQYLKIANINISGHAQVPILGDEPFQLEMVPV